ncbi:hypothetical protein AB0L06_27970 [Spirillospora sp. NPDC052269]
MSENLINSLTPHMAPPVTREPIRSTGDTGENADGATLSYAGEKTGTGFLFADDDAE